MNRKPQTINRDSLSGSFILLFYLYGLVSGRAAGAESQPGKINELSKAKTSEEDVDRAKRP